jgi:uncharacterized phiE125 gp8 family phage protein
VLPSIPWSLSLKTGPTAEPVSLDDVRRQARIESSVDDIDPLLAVYLASAREFAEARTGRALMTQTWYLKLDDFPLWDAPIWIPRPPLQSVTAVTYVDGFGTTQTWPSSQYIVSAPAGPNAQFGRIAPGANFSYPATEDRIEAVTVEFVCGWTAEDLVPGKIKAAILQLAAHQYEHREPIVIGTISSEIPLSALALLDSAMAVRL